MTSKVVWLCKHLQFSKITAKTKLGNNYGHHKPQCNHMCVVSTTKTDSSIAHPVSNACDEVLDIQLGGAAFLARGVGTLQASSSFTQSSTLTQRGVLDVFKVFDLTGASL